MVHVAFVVSTLRRSGPVRQLLNIVSNLDRSQIDVSVLTLSPEGEDSMLSSFDQGGVRVHSLNLGRFESGIVGTRRINAYFNGKDIDIVHTTGLRADALVASSALRARHILTLRNFPLDDYPAKFGALKGRLMARQHLATIRKAPHLVACSQHLQERFAKVGISTDIIPNGVDTSRFAKATSYERERARSALGLAPSDFVFVSVGSLIPRKNMGELLSALEVLKDKKQLRLVLVGDGPERNSLETSMRMDERIIFVGSAEDVRPYLTAADCFVSSSRAEGLPNSVLEALGCGLPSILSNIGPHTEIADTLQNAAIKVYPLGNVNALAAALSESAFSDTDTYDHDLGPFQASTMAMQYQLRYLQLHNSRAISRQL